MKNDKICMVYLFTNYKGKKLGTPETIPLRLFTRQNQYIFWKMTVIRNHYEPLFATDVKNCKETRDNFNIKIQTLALSSQMVQFALENFD